MTGPLWRRVLMLTWLPVLLLLCWGVFSAGSTSFFFPPLSTILTAFSDEWIFERVPTDLLPSLARFGIGYLLACALGLVGGIVIGRSRPLQRALTPIIDFLRAVPPPAIIPLALLTLGVGDVSKIAVIAFGGLFPVLLNVIDGARGIDSLYLDASRVFGLSRWQRVRHVLLPSVLPNFFTGARLALAIALILMVVTEMIGPTNGLGYVVRNNQERYLIPAMWAGIIMIGIIGFVTNQLFVLIERTTLSWYAGWRGLDGDPEPIRTTRSTSRSRA